MKPDGLTLIEILVALALAVMIAFAASNLLISSTQSSTDLQARNELLEEAQIAQNYMAWQLREAVYVFPAGQVLNIGGGDTTIRPAPGPWQVGNNSAPILAFIKPPATTVGNCPANPDRCYYFYAYYPMSRSKWVEKSSSFNYPGDDSLNSDRWVLVEYRRQLDTPPTLTSLATPPTYGKSSGRLLMDYLRPTAFEPSAPPLFEFGSNLNPSLAPWQQTPGNISVTINMAVSRQVRGKDVTVPGYNASSPPGEKVTPLVVMPRNLGNLSP